MIKKKKFVFPDQKLLERDKGIFVSDNARNLIEKLLIKEPENRLGSKNGVEEILAHPWFSDIDRILMMNKKIKPEFIPKVKPDKEILKESQKLTDKKRIKVTLHLSDDTMVQDVTWAQLKAQAMSENYMTNAWFVSIEFDFNLFSKLDMNEYHQMLVNELREAQRKQKNLLSLKPIAVTTPTTWGDMKHIFMSQTTDLDHSLPMNEQTEAALIFVRNFYLVTFLQNELSIEDQWIVRRLVDAQKS